MRLAGKHNAPRGTLLGRVQVYVVRPNRADARRAELLEIDAGRRYEPRGDGIRGLIRGRRLGHRRNRGRFEMDAIVRRNHRQVRNDAFVRQVRLRTNRSFQSAKEFRWRRASQVGIDRRTRGKTKRCTFATASSLL